MKNYTRRLSGTRILGLGFSFSFLLQSWRRISCSPPTHKHTQGKHKPELGILQTFQRTGMVQNVILVFFRRRLSQRPAVEELERRNILKREYFLLKIFYIFAETSNYICETYSFHILIYWDYFLYLKVFMFNMLCVSNIAEMRIYTLLNENLHMQFSTEKRDLLKFQLWNNIYCEHTAMGVWEGSSIQVSCSQWHTNCHFWSHWLSWLKGSGQSILAKVWGHFQRWVRELPLWDINNYRGRIPGLL